MISRGGIPVAKGSPQGEQTSPSKLNIGGKKYCKGRASSREPLAAGDFRGVRTHEKEKGGAVSGGYHKR